MKRKAKTRFQITYRSWTEHPPFKANHTDELEAIDDADALQKFNTLKTEYERCESFKLFKIVRKTATRREITTIITTKTRLA